MAGSNSDLTELPGKPGADIFNFGSSPGTYNQFNSTNHFALAYNVTNVGFTGVQISRDDLDTPSGRDHEPLRSHLDRLRCAR